MQIRHCSLIAAATFALLFTTGQHSWANESIGVAVKAGTPGIGAEISAPLLPGTRIRGGFNYLSYSFDSTISDIDYEFEPEYNSVSLLLDVHPFGGTFFLSGGAYFNNNSVDVTGSIGRDKIPSGYSQYASLADLVSLSGEVEFNPIAPYIGMGWRSNSGNSGWGFAFELGVLYQGAPDVSNLRVNAPVDVNGIRQVQQFLAEQEAEIEDELEWFEFYPVVSAALTYHF